MQKSLIYKKYTRRLQKKFQKYLKIKFICYQSTRLFKQWKSSEHDRFRWLKNQTFGLFLLYYSSYQVFTL